MNHNYKMFQAVLQNTEISTALMGLTVFPIITTGVSKPTIYSISLTLAPMMLEIPFIFAQYFCNNLGLCPKKLKPSHVSNISNLYAPSSH